MYLFVILTSMFMFTSCEKDLDVDIDITVTCNVVIKNPTQYGANDGSIAINVLTGNLPFEFKLMPNNIISSNGTFDSLTAGDYTISVTDSRYKNYSEIIRLTEPNNLIVKIDVNDVTYKDGDDGSIHIIVESGNSPFEYKINKFTKSSNTNNDGVFNNLVAGDYIITVTDSVFQTFTDTITINQPTDPITFTYELVHNDYNDCEGSITINATGGTPPYKYSINDGRNYETSNVFNYLTGSYYDIVVKDSKGVVSETKKVLIHNPFNVIFNTVNNTIRIDIIGASEAPFTFKIEGFNIFEITSPIYSNYYEFENIPSGVYMVTATDNLNRIRYKEVEIN